MSGRYGRGVGRSLVTAPTMRGRVTVKRGQPSGGKVEGCGRYASA